MFYAWRKCLFYDKRNLDLDCIRRLTDIDIVHNINQNCIRERGSAHKKTVPVDKVCKFIVLIFFVTCSLFATSSLITS